MPALEDKTYLTRTYGNSIGKATVTGYCIKFKDLSDINAGTFYADTHRGDASTSMRIRRPASRH